MPDKERNRDSELFKCNASHPVVTRVGYSIQMSAD